jgi:hypothetical protein
MSVVGGRSAVTHFYLKQFMSLQLAMGFGDFDLLKVGGVAVRAKS